ncbi:DUF6894 family protein [Methylobacterium sp. A54F]
MPLFYFHLRSGRSLNLDEFGLELDGLEAAYLEACRAIPDMARECVQANARRPSAFEITDAGGRLLMEVPFSEILDRHPARPGPPALQRRAQAEVARSRRLRAALDLQLAALQETLHTTKALVARAQAACLPAAAPAVVPPPGPAPWPISGPISGPTRGPTSGS